MIQIKHEEQYSLVVPSNLSDAAGFDELEQKISESLENGHRNFILNLEGLHEVPGDIAPNFAQLKSIIEKEDGRLVIACPPALIEASLEENEIVSTPTLNEATDYIFMEEIEKQLLGGGDDEWGEEE